MDQTATGRSESVKATTPHLGAAGAAETPRPTAEQQHDEPGSRGSGLLAPLRWLGRKLSGLLRWVAKRLRAPLRPMARSLMLRWERLPAPLRSLVSLFASGRERGFGFWWLVVTLGIAVALGLVVALLLIPVALLVVAIWALVRRRRRKRDDRDNRKTRAPARGTKQRFGTPGRTAAEAPATAGAA